MEERDVVIGSYQQEFGVGEGDGHVRRACNARAQQEVFPGSHLRYPTEGEALATDFNLEKKE